MTVKRSKDQRSFPPTFGNQRLRATFKPTRVGDRRQRVEAKSVKSFMRRIFSRRKV